MYLYSAVYYYSVNYKINKCFVSSFFAHWLPNVVWTSKSLCWASHTLWGSGIHCRWGFNILALLGMLPVAILILCHLLLLVSQMFLLIGYVPVCDSDVLLLLVHLFIYSALLDDGKHAPSRGRHSAIEKCQPGKGNLCKASAPHDRLLRYFQP